MDRTHRSRLAASLVRLTAASALLIGIAAVRVPAQVEKSLLQFGPAAGTKLVYTINGQVSVGGKDFGGFSLDLNSSCQGDIRFWVKNAARDTVRVPEPLRAGDGTWSADGHYFRREVDPNLQAAARPTGPTRVPGYGAWEMAPT